MFSKIKSAFSFYTGIVKNEVELRRQAKYTIISESFCNDDIQVVLRPKGMGKPFKKRIDDIHNKEWLAELEHEDAARIAFLSYVKNSGNFDIIKNFPARKTRITKNVLIICALFVSCLVLSNIAGFKLTAITLFGHTLDFPAALVFFPFTYLFDDTITEVYGFAVSRLIIWGSIAASSLVTLGLFFCVHMPASEHWGLQPEFATIFTNPPRILAASFCAYLIGEFLNSVVLSKMKVLTKGRFYALRLIASTSVGALFDSIIFVYMAFYGLVSEDILTRMILIQYFFKVGYEVIALPLTYFVTGYLKHKDKTDYYDFETKYNPFSFKVELYQAVNHHKTKVLDNVVNLKDLGNAEPAL